MNSILVTPTNGLTNSLDFFLKLGCTHHIHMKRHWISDGKFLLEIDESRTARPGIKLYKEDWGEEIEELQKITAIKKSENSAALNDTSGVRIELHNSILDLDFEVSDFPSSILGNFAGLSLEGIDLSAMYPIYKILGFEITMGGTDKSWMVASNSDGMSISFMGAGTCPHLFFNPSMTFFNGKDNLKVIEKIKQAEIQIAEEITHFNPDGIVDNIILREPGGFGFFIFSD